MRWSRKTRGGGAPVAGTALLDEVLKAKGGSGPQLSPQQIRRELVSPGFAAVEFAHDGGEPKPEPASVQSTVFGVKDAGGNVAGAWRIAWNGSVLTFGSVRTVLWEWPTRSGGVDPDFVDGVQRVGADQRTYPSYGTESIAEIAAVGNADYVFWLRFVNERTRQKVRLQAVGFDEPRLVALAEAAGIHYRRYRLDVASSDIEVLRSWDYFPGTGSNLWTTRTSVRRDTWISGRPQRAA